MANESLYNKGRFSQLLVLLQAGGFAVHSTITDAGSSMAKIVSKKTGRTILFGLGGSLVDAIERAIGKAPIVNDRASTTPISAESAATQYRRTHLPTL